MKLNCLFLKIQANIREETDRQLRHQQQRAQQEGEEVGDSSLQKYFKNFKINIITFLLKSIPNLR
jgi:hypothetical protein